MALTPQDIAQKAGEEARNILGAVPGLAADGAANYIKIGTPPSLIPNVGLAVARQACRRYADNPGGVPGAAAAGFERVCRPYLDNIGYGSGPLLDQPFTGGQCPVAYNVTFNATGASGACNPIQFGTSTTSAGIGPISISRFHDTAISGQSGGLCPGFTYNVVRLTNAAGTTTLVGQGRGIRLNSISVSRVDGQPDSCGDRPIIIVPPAPPAVPGPVREPFKPTPDTNINIDVTIGPTGDVNFNIGTGPITIDPFGGGGSGGGGGGAPGSGLPPGDIGQPGAEEPTGEDGVASGCAPPNSVLVGVKVNIVSAPLFASQYDPLVRRGACYVYMGTSGNLALEPAGVAVRSGQMFYAYPDNLTCWEVRANTGYVLQVIPYYRALEPQEV